MISWFDWWIWIFPQPQALRIGSDGIAGAQLAQRGWTWWITLNHGEALRTWIYMDHQGSYVIMLPHPGCTSQGAATRMVGKTVFNPRSSRSHAVVMRGCSKAFKNFCLRWRSDLRSIKLVWVKSRPKTIKDPVFFFTFDPERLCSSEAAHLLVPGGQRSSSDVESPLRPWHLLLTAGWLLKYVLPYAILWPPFLIYLWIFQSPSRWSSSLSTLGTILKNPGAIPFSDAASRNEESYGSRLRHLPSCTRETRVYLVDLAGIIMWFKVSKNTLSSPVRSFFEKMLSVFLRRDWNTPFLCLTGSERAGMHALAAEQLKEGEHINLSNLAWNAWNVVWGLSNLQIQGSWFDFILHFGSKLGRWDNWSFWKDFLWCLHILKASLPSLQNPEVPLISLLSPPKLLSILPDFGDTAQCSAHDKAVHECEFEKHPIACCWTPLVSKGSWCCDCDTPQKTFQRNWKVYHTYHHGVFNIPDCWRNMEKPI